MMPFALQASTSHFALHNSGSEHNQAKPDPTPHPAFLKQPLPLSLQGSQQQRLPQAAPPLLHAFPQHSSQGSMLVSYKDHLWQSPEGDSPHSGMTASLQASLSTNTRTSSGAGRHPLSSSQQPKPQAPPPPPLPLHSRHGPDSHLSGPSLSTASDSVSNQDSASVTHSAQSMSHGSGDSQSVNTAEGSNQAVDIVRELTLGSDLSDRLRAQVNATGGGSIQIPDVRVRPEEASARLVESRGSPSAIRAPPGSALAVHHQADSLQQIPLPLEAPSAGMPSVKIVLR